MPTNVNYRANLFAMKELGCTHVVVSTACGSLREQYEPGHIIVIDQFIDRTTRRTSTFYDGLPDHAPGVLHTEATHPPPFIFRAPRELDLVPSAVPTKPLTFC